jgi:hypothetical protein
MNALPPKFSIFKRQRASYSEKVEGLDLVNSQVESNKDCVEMTIYLEIRRLVDT